MGEKLLTYPEAAEFLRWKVQTLKKKVRHKEIPYIKIGLRSVRFREQDLMAHLATEVPPAHPKKPRRNGSRA